jgi:hypothetical protein
VWYFSTFSTEEQVHGVLSYENLCLYIWLDGLGTIEFCFGLLYSDVASTDEFVGFFLQFASSYFIKKSIRLWFRLRKQVRINGKITSFCYVFLFIAAKLVRIREIFTIFAALM